MSDSRVLPVFWRLFLPIALTHIASAQFNPAPGPVSPVSLAPQHSPISIVSGNFNGDSLPDLAVANQYDGTVTILIGVANGGFTASGVVKVGNDPSSMAVAYFDNDNYQDLVVANQTDNTLTVLDGNGTGGFTANAPALSLGGGQSPDFVAVGDFGGDGKTDLAIANRKTDNVTVLLGDGSGGVKARLGPFPVGNPMLGPASPSSIAVGDFNGDGIPDLAVTDELQNTVTVLLGDGTGGFKQPAASPFLVGANPSFIVAADFNGDGNIDLAVSNLSSNNVTVLLGNGSGGFAAAPAGPFAVGANPVSMAPADFNGDGFLDLAVANSASNSVTVLLGDGMGGFKGASGSPYTVGSRPMSVAVADFNRDGKLDLAVANFGDDDVTVLLNAFSVAPVMVSSAAYSAATPVALGSMVSIFGANSVAAAAAASSPTDLPMCLAGIRVTVADASGVKSKPIFLYYVGPGQINGMVPEVAATGAATFTISEYPDLSCMLPSTAVLQKGSVTIASTSPGLFTANSTGKGAASGYFMADVASGSPTSMLYNCPSPGACLPTPVDVSAGSSGLVLYGTGIRNRASLSGVTVTIGGQTFTPYYAGPAPGGPDGLDQVNVAVPATLAGSGVVYVTVSVAGATSNQATINLK